MPNYPLTLHQPECLKRVRAALDAVDFTEQNVFDALGQQGSPSVDTSVTNLQYLLRRVSGGSPLETLIRLFLLRTPVALSAFASSVRPSSDADCLSVGLIHPPDDSVASTVQLAPILDRLVVASDWRLSDSDPELVLGVTRSAWALAQWTVRANCRDFLDLGTGCGIQAFLAASHCENVVGVDINPRALHMARFAAQLNAFERMEFLHGDFFAPIEHRLFDQIVANPPFVVSPEKRFLFRDSGEQGDQVSERLARSVPSFLRDGGLAQIVCNWVHIRDQDWHERLSAWFQNSNCDVWILHTSTQDVADYAQKWIRDTNEDLKDPSATFASWIDYYDRLGVEAISSGMLILRRRNGPNWLRYDQVSKPQGPAADAIAYGIAARTFIEQLDDDTLLSQQVVVPPDVQLEQVLQPSEGGWSIAEATIRQVGGLAFSAKIDGHLLALVNRFHAPRRVEEVLGEMATSFGQPVHQLHAAALPAVRGLIEKGFLKPT